GEQQQAEGRAQQGDPALCDKRCHGAQLLVCWRSSPDATYRKGASKPPSCSRGMNGPSSLPVLSAGGGRQSSTVAVHSASWPSWPPTPKPYTSGRAGPSGAHVVGCHRRRLSVSRMSPGECQGTTSVSRLESSMLASRLALSSDAMIAVRP